MLTKVPHAFLVRVIQEKIALLDGPVDLEAKTQTCILHQVRQDVLRQALAGEHKSDHCMQIHVHPQSFWLCKHTVALLYCTSSLLLSRLDIETSSIFICQNYQMSRHCCGHAVAQQASAKTGLQQEGNTQLAAQRH